MNMIGRTISHYKIIEKIGEGGMGVVYKAEDTKLKRTVALKFLAPELTRDPEAKQRFVQEAQAASALDHPNICTIHEIDETKDDQMFICMACYQGKTVKKKVEQGPLKLEEATDIATQVAQGLAKAHSKGIVHRDIKPANILITEDGQTKILDFGLAKLAGQTRVTRAGITVGTVAYVSPEQARGGELDQRTDIWSLGVVLYEMLTGYLPFKGENPEAMLYSIFHQEPQLIGRLRADIPKPLEQIVNKMLQKEVQERYEDMETLIADLKSVDQELRSTLLRPSSVKAIRKTGRIGIKRIKNLLIPVCILSGLVVAFLLIRTLFWEEAVAERRTPMAVMPFKNLTGDHSFDYLSEAIPNLLITNLEQSEDLSLMTWERMHDLLKIMGKEDIKTIDEDLGFELCRMDGIETIVLGSFTKAGDMFATEVKVLDVETKRLLTSTSSKGEGVASILKLQIDELSKDISVGVGLSERKIAATKLQITDVTTTSMDAYNYFLRGRDDYEKIYLDDARRFLQKAIELDSTFAVAHLYLAWVHGHLGDTKARDESFEKAKTFSERATDKERLYIEAFYASDIERNSEKGFRILEEMATKYPKEKRAHLYLGVHYFRRKSFYEAIEEFNKALELDANYGVCINMLAYTYADIGNFEKAIEYFRRYASVSPGDANPFDSMAEIYLRMGRLDEAITKYKEALAVKSDFGADWKIAYIFALKEDYPEAMKWVDQFITMAPSPGIRAEGYLWKGFYHYWLGSLDQSLNEFDRAADLWEAIGNDAGKAFIDWTKAWIYYDRGELKLGQKYYKSWFDFVRTEPDSSYMPTYTAVCGFYLGLVDLKEGRIDSAKSKLTKMKSLLSKIDPPVRERITLYYDLLYGEVLFAEDSTQKAITVCEKVSPLTIPSMYTRDILPYNAPFPKDGLAQAYQQKGDIDKAITEYERLITFDPRNKERSLIYPKYHYRLAKLYEEKGWLTKAIEEYEKFLEIWKNADPDLPEVEDTRIRLSKLKATS